MRHAHPQSCTFVGDNATLAEGNFQDKILEHCFTFHVQAALHHGGVKRSKRRHLMFIT